MAFRRTMAGVVLVTALAVCAPLEVPLSRLRQIGQAEAQNRVEVTTSGIVTYVTTPRRAFFLQDGRHGIYVMDAHQSLVKAGDRVRVRARLYPGGYAPSLEAEAVEVVGAGQLPAPLLVGPHELLQGNYDCVRVQLEGPLRSVDYGQSKPYLRLDHAGHVFRVRLDSLSPDRAQSWLGRTLRATGVAATIFNRHGQLTDAILIASSDADLSAVAGKAYQPPALAPISSILTFTPGETADPGVRIAGRLTYSRQDRMHVVQDASGGVVIESSGPVHLPLGSPVEVTGFEKLDPLAPSLTDAAVTAIPSAPALQPNPTTPLDIVAERWQARLVRLEGTLESISPSATGGVSLRFLSGGREFSADLDPDQQLPASIEPGARFAVTGVAFLTGFAYGDANRIWFRLQLRTPDDLRLLAAAAFWNGDRVSRLALGLVAGVVAALVWILMLRRRVRAQSALAREALAQERQAHSSFQELCENASDLIFTFDRDGRILFSNRAASLLTGYPPEELAGADYTLLLPDGSRERWRRFIERSMASRELTLRTERHLTARCGEIVTVEFNCRIFPGSDSQPLTVQVIGRDITQRKRLEETLERARQKAEEANLAKGEFLAKMSHEIRTPMNGVRGMTELLLDTPLDARQRNMAATIRDSAAALLRVINDILDFSKLEAEMVEIQSGPVDLRRVLEDVVDLLGFAAGEKHLELIVDYHPDCPRHFVTDGGRLRQILLNLVGNSLKFTEQGYVRLVVSYTAPMVSIAVEDSGVGIPPGKLPLLFQKFQQLDNSSSRRFGGSGLGLAITRSLVELMGGRIEVESAEGQGSCFRCWLPLPVDAAAETARSVYAPLGGTVIVADTALARHNAWQNLLRSFGVRAVLTTEFDRALRQFEQLHGEERELVVVAPAGAVSLPAGLSEEALGRALLLVWPDQREQAVALAGGWRVLTRPQHPDHLYATLAGIRRGESTSRSPMELLTRDPYPQLGLRVLVAEDNPVNLRVATAFLERLGCEVSAAADGLAAVGLIEQHHYDAVLMDCHMPRMDGYEATREIRSRGGRLAELPIVALTAAALPEDQARCLAAGMQYYLSKPLDSSELERLLQSLAPTASAC
ncbi:MAG: response regulator [Bryobacteraceae bacterium]|nr:response regulator [Bryobacteraceae bacterium]